MTEPSSNQAFAQTWDSFDNGFSTGVPGARWCYFELGPYVSNDGIITTSPEGLRVISKGKNPATGEPAYTHTLPQEKDPSGVPGQFDHVKWLVYMNHKASAGLPGWDAVHGQELAFETWISGQTFGTHAHPFGDAVRDPGDDLRLAMLGQITCDFESGMVFDFLFTNKRLYAFYERLTFARTPQKNYAAFSYAVPVAQRTPGALHHVKIAYDRKAGVVRYLVEGQEVLRVRPGRHIDSQWLMIDNGGDEEDVDMRQLVGGLGMFSLLDGLDSGRRLVRLSGDPGYYQPHRGMGPPTVAFMDEQSHPGNRLFGQGGELRSLRYVVSSTPR